jgi:hypothetical protein
VESSSTDREVMANRPDIKIKNKKEKTYILIYVVISANTNVVQQEAEKKLNTRDYIQKYRECGT